MIYNETIDLYTATHPTFHDVTEDLRRIAKTTGVKNGIATIYSPHTTCSVLIQEMSDGQAYNGEELINQDLVNVFEKIIPTCRNEGQYLHPCQKHIELGLSVLGEEPICSLNTDAHLRSVIMGRSETIPIIDGELQLGQFGHVWFADFDQVRARKRRVIIQIMGE